MNKAKMLLVAWLGLCAGAAAGADAAFADATTQGDAGSFSLQAGFAPASADLGRSIDIYVLAVVPQQGGQMRQYAKTVDDLWLAAAVPPLPPYRTGVVASATHTLDIVRTLDVRGLTGTALYVGYGLAEGAVSSYDDMAGRGNYRLIHTLGQTSGGGTPTGPSHVAACPADVAAPLFGTSPVAIEDFIAFRPLGFMSAPIHTFPAKHSAFSMTPIGATAVPKPVRAPGSAIVTEIYEAGFSATGKKNYQVFLHPCREVRAYFGHLATLSDKLAAEFARAAPSCNSFDSGDGGLTTTCRRENLAIALDEGEIFGTGPDTSGVDFGVLDFRRAPAAFIDLSHYDAYYPYYASPLDYFSASVRARIEAKTGSVFGAPWRTTAPIGGGYMQDIPGTAQGNWFLPSQYHANTTDLSRFLGLAHDYVDPSQPVMAAGVSIQGMRLGLYAFQPRSDGVVNRDFGAVVPDGRSYCFESFLADKTVGGLPLGQPDGVLLMALPDALTLKVELVAAASCAAVADHAPGAAATTFVR